MFISFPFDICTVTVFAEYIKRRMEHDRVITLFLALYTDVFPATFELLLAKYEQNACLAADF